jgi:hypothetical protein
MQLTRTARFSSGWRRLGLCCGISAVATLFFQLGVARGLLLGNYWLLLFVPWLACVGWFLAAQPIRGRSVYIKALFAGALAFAMAASAISALLLFVFVLPD